MSKNRKIILIISLFLAVAVIYGGVYLFFKGKEKTITDENSAQISGFGKIIENLTAPEQKEPMPEAKIKEINEALKKLTAPK
jgi:hypothetical protein